MEGITSLVELTKALSKFQGAMSSVPKTSVNPFFKSRYASLDAVWEACRKPLTENGLALVQTTDVTDGHLFLLTTLLHTSGESISSRYPLSPMRQVGGQGWTVSEDPQSIGSAITYARRYAMCALLGISADDDDDAERATHGTPRAASTQKPPSASKTPAEAPKRAQTASVAPVGEKDAAPQGVRLGKDALLVAIRGEREGLGWTPADLAVWITQRFPHLVGKQLKDLTQDQLEGVYEALYNESQARAASELEREGQ